ncbi:MAG TPA: PEGA domain-containing protein [Candidatus Saccharimonadales bacterium]|nr:PEGA domain-containing protein [Candidatus Saccharimonadales bacterium]
MNTTKNRIIIATILIAVALLIGTIITLLNRGGGAIVLYTAPKDVTISVDGELLGTKKTGDKIKINNGTHTITASRDGFTSQDTTLTVSQNTESKAYLTLQPNSEAAKNLMATESEQYNLEFVANRGADQSVELLYNNNPIINMLPYYGRLFDIYQAPSQLYPQKQGAMGVRIEAYGPVERQAALEAIRREGYDPTDYEIFFVPLEYKTRDQE